MNLTMTKMTKLDPSIIVIFGITGDLSQRYLLPALYHLMKDGLLHDKTEIIGVSRRNVSVHDLLSGVDLCVEEENDVCDPEALKKMERRLRMEQMDLADQASYHELLKKLNAIEEERGVCMNRLYYLSVPPQVYAPIIKQMGEAKLNGSCQHDVAASRLLIEKPFGYDLPSAKSLVEETSKTFKEEQVFRIDHYLAKETVQNILTFRFQNPIFETIWNSDHISSIEISAGEKIGIEGRAQFYEPLGALRDFIQSHLLQLLAIIAMERPEKIDSQHIHESKQQILSRVLAIPPDHIDKDAIRGQYKGYREEVGNKKSNTETFAGIRVFIDDPGWQNVPFTLWTGKNLSEKKTEIKICFNGRDGEKANYLRLRIQPHEGIEVDLLAKKPGFDTELQPAVMDFSYQQSFNNHEHPDAYERVLVDAVRGDRTLFATSQEVIEAWRIVQPVLHNWSRDSDNMISYNAGTPGTKLAQEIL